MSPEGPEGDSKERETGPDADDGRLFQNRINWWRCRDCRKRSRLRPQEPYRLLPSSYAGPYRTAPREAIVFGGLPYPDRFKVDAGPRTKKTPGPFFRRSRANNWQRPTLAGPFAQLPSARQRFTSGFGMGPGGSIALWSPEAGRCAGIHPTRGLQLPLRQPLSDIHVKNSINRSVSRSL